MPSAKCEGCALCEVRINRVKVNLHVTSFLHRLAGLVVTIAQSSDRRPSSDDFIPSLSLVSAGLTLRIQRVPFDRTGVLPFART